MLALGTRRRDLAATGGWSRWPPRSSATRCPKRVRVTAMRAQASILLGCDAAIRVDPTDATDRAYRMLARRLHASFTTFATDDAWPWPEPILTYENGLLAARADRGRPLARLDRDDRGRPALPSTG